MCFMPLPEKGRGLFHANYPVGWAFFVYAFAMLFLTDAILPEKEGYV